VHLCLEWIGSEADQEQYQIEEQWIVHHSGMALDLGSVAAPRNHVGEPKPGSASRSQLSSSLGSTLVIRSMLTSTALPKKAMCQTVDGFTRAAVDRLAADGYARLAIYNYCLDCGVTLYRWVWAPRLTTISVSWPTFNASIA